MKRIQPSLRNNIASLGLFQISLYVFPVAQAWVTTRALGVQMWGRVAFAQAVLYYFAVLINWGFAISSVQRIAHHRGDPGLIYDTFFCILSCKVLLFVIAALTLLLLVCSVDTFYIYRWYYYGGTLFLLAEALMPAWFLAAVERMFWFSLLQIVARLFGLVAILLIVRRPEQAPLVIALNGGAGCCAAIASLTAIFFQHRGHPSQLSVSAIYRELRIGFPIFISSVSVSCYVNIIPVAIGFLLGPSAVALYSVADRLRVAAQSLLSPISSALFPRITRVIADKRGRDAVDLLRRSSLCLIPLSLLCSVCIYVFSDLAVKMIAGQKFAEAAHILRFLSPLPLIMSASTIVGTQIMLPLGEKSIFSFILGFSGLLAIASIYPLVSTMGINGAVIVSLASETLVSLAMLVALRSMNLMARIAQSQHE